MLKIYYMYTYCIDLQKIYYIYQGCIEHIIIYKYSYIIFFMIILFVFYILLKYSDVCLRNDLGD